jgi:hypothetical protein
VQKPIQIGGPVQIGGAAPGGGGGFQPAYLNGHLAGGIIFLDPQFQPAAVVVLPGGFAGAIGKGAIGLGAGIGAAGLVDPINKLPGEVSFSPKQCSCKDDCKPPDECCPFVAPGSSVMTAFDNIQRGKLCDNTDGCWVHVPFKREALVCVPDLCDTGAPCPNARVRFIQHGQVNALSIFVNPNTCDEKSFSCEALMTPWCIDEGKAGTPTFEDDPTIVTPSECEFVKDADCPGLLFDLAQDFKGRLCIGQQAQWQFRNMLIVQCESCKDSDVRGKWYVIECTEIEIKITAGIPNWKQKRCTSITCSDVQYTGSGRVATKPSALCTKATSCVSLPTIEEKLNLNFYMYSLKTTDPRKGWHPSACTDDHKKTIDPKTYL